MSRNSETIFVSYAKPDREIVREVIRFLDSAGLDTWFDERNLLAGQEWQTVIREAIGDSALFLLCLSTNSVNRTGFCQKELRISLEMADRRPDGQVFIMPVRLNACAL